MTDAVHRQSSREDYIYRDAYYRVPAASLNSRSPGKLLEFWQNPKSPGKLLEFWQISWKFLKISWNFTSKPQAGLKQLIRAHGVELERDPRSRPTGRDRWLTFVVLTTVARSK